MVYVSVWGNVGSIGSVEVELGWGAEMLSLSYTCFTQFYLEAK